MSPLALPDGQWPVAKKSFGLKGLPGCIDDTREESRWPSLRQDVSSLQEGVVDHPKCGTFVQSHDVQKVHPFFGPRFQLRQEPSFATAQTKVLLFGRAAKLMS